MHEIDDIDDRNVGVNVGGDRCREVRDISECNRMRAVNGHIAAELAQRADDRAEVYRIWRAITEE
jgi:hypothetical protein